MSRASRRCSWSSECDARVENVSGYGDVSLHGQSHGESFLALLEHRFFGHGLYILDEPEAALSVRGLLALIRRMHDLVADGSQFIVSTHSPILLGFPDARIHLLDEDGVREVDYDEAPQVELTRAFLDAPDRFFRELLE